MMNPEQRIREIDRQIIVISAIDAPGTILLGLGLYGKFAADGEAFHPLLNEQAVVNSMLLLGLVIMIWCGGRILKLSKEKAELKNRNTFP